MAARFPSSPMSPTIGIIIPSDQKTFLSIKQELNQILLKFKFLDIFSIYFCIKFYLYFAILFIFYNVFKIINFCSHR